MNAYSANGLILLPSMAEQDGGTLLAKYVCTCTSWMPPASGLRHPVCPVSAPGFQSPQLLAPAHKSPWGCSPTRVAGRDQAPLHTAAQAQTHTWIHGAAGLRRWRFPSKDAVTTHASCAHTHMSKWSPDSPIPLWDVWDLLAPPVASPQTLWHLQNPASVSGSNGLTLTRGLVLLGIHCPSHANSGLLHSDPKHT